MQPIPSALVTRVRLSATDIAFYEGLVRKTAAMYAPHIQEDYDDIVAILRIKVWRALEAYDPSRSRQPVERYVFSCVKNQVKDLLKRRKRHEVYFHELEASTGKSYDEVFLTVAADEVYADVERETIAMPSTLTGVERDVVLRLYLGESVREVAVGLGVTWPEVERIVAVVREKLAHWRPTPASAAVPVAA